MNKKNNCHVACSVEVALDVIGGKWKGVVLYHLLKGLKRFNELQKLIPGVSQRMLTKQLRELASYGLVKRTVYPVVPPKVEYALTDLGLTLEPVIESLREWGEGPGKEALKTMSA